MEAEELNLEVLMRLSKRQLCDSAISGWIESNWRSFVKTPDDMEMRARELQTASHNRTVIYPEVVQHPGLIALPKPWTRKDTLRLEAASKLKRPPIQKRGR